jgi:hypothetical protein
MRGTIEITTISHCKNVCTYCPQSLLAKRYQHPDKVMSLDTFEKCLAKVPQDIWIDFAGYAEPFLNPNCAELLLAANKARYNIRLYTTLVGLTEETINKIKSIVFSSVILHLPDNEGYMKANVDDEYCRLAEKFIYNIGVTSSHVYGSLHNKLRGIISNCNEKPLNNQHLHTRANNVQSTKIELKPMNYISGPIECGVIVRKGGTMMNHNVLMPNGDVLLCCMDYGLEHKIGNLLTDNYDDLFQSAEYKRVVQGMNGDENIEILCRTCSEAYPKK